MAVCRTFLRWCANNDLLGAGNPADAITGPDSTLRRSYKRTYGKVQAKHPGRWLNRDQTTAMQNFPTANDVDLRDAIVLRLGLLGMRRSEITNLTIAAVRNLPTITWTGKGRKPRRTTAGPTLFTLLARYLDVYARHHPLDPETPLICPASGGNDRTPAIRWGTHAGRDCVYRIVRQRAAAAGLGHVATHDLRRSAAGLLHHATSADGAHHFDLLDIQRVLGHSDPATTMRCYLEPLDTEVFDRAAQLLD